MSQGLRLAYLVHDLHDPAVARRLDMLRLHIRDAVVIGFYRSGEPPVSISGTGSSSSPPSSSGVVIVDDDVDAPKLFDDCRDGSPHRRVIGHVRFNTEGVG